MNAFVNENSTAGQGFVSQQTVVPDEIVDMSQSWRTIKRAKWIIFFTTLFGLIIGGFIATSATPVYRATAKIMADPQQPNADSNEQYLASSLVFLYYQTQYEIIQSRNLAEIVVDKLNLVERYKAQQASLPAEKSGFGGYFSEIITNISTLVSNNEQRVQLAPTDSGIRLMLASDIQDNIEVNGGKQSQIINISYIAEDPQKAADIINALSDAYIQFGLELRLSEVKSTQSWLTEQYVQLKTNLRDSENKLSTFRNQQKMVDTEQQQRMTNTQLQSLNSELIRAKTQLSAAEEQFLAIKGVKANSKSLYSIGPVLENRATNDMVKDEARLSQRVNELDERYGAKHPKMIAARSELNSAQNALEAEVNKVVLNIEKNYRLAKVQVKNIYDLIAQKTTGIQSSQGDNFALVSLEREVENNRRVYESFQSRLMEANVKSEITASNVQVIDRAVVPEAPFKPNIKLIFILAGGLSLFFAVILAFLRESLGNTFKTPDAIEQRLALPSLGITPIVKKLKGGAIPEKQYLNDRRSAFSESINAIRTSLLFSNIDNPPKTILVTSSTGSEGKSTLAINLATSFSQQGRTLLLEVDLRKPSIAKNLQLESKLGLSDLVSGSVNSADSSFKTDINGLFSIITCGTVPQNPLELLSSQKFDKLFASLKNHFDYIILDGPPILPVSDSCIIAVKVDAVIFAIKAESTKVNVSKQAVKRLQKLSANVVGAVLTVAEPHKMSYYGDHYYADEYYGVKPDKSAPESVLT